MQSVIIIGTGKTAELAYEYLKDSFDIIGFAETKPESMFWNGKPLFSIEHTINSFNKELVKLFVAIGVNKLNTVRQKLYSDLLAEGWDFISYIHPRATVAPTAKVGKNCIVMEENVIQDFTIIGDNNILWSGNHIGHHSTIGSHNFISSHVVICGNCTIGDNNFFGVNSCVGDNITVGSYNWFSPLTATIKSIQDDNLLVMPKTDIAAIPARKYFKVP
jgi:sugar O-acyltransferase (sialic acid O-acetyltransferase NeuD family)